MPLFGKKKPDDMKEKELFENGAKAFSEQNWEEAVEYLRILVNKTPDFTQGKEMLAVSLIQTQNADEALVHCKQLVEKDPQNPMYHVHLGSCYQLQGNNEKAIEELGHSLVLQENPVIRGVMLYLKTPDIPLVNLDAIDKSGSALLANLMANLGSEESLARFKELGIDESYAEASVKASEVGKKMQDDLLEAKDPEQYMKQIAEACIDNDCYALTEDLLVKYKDIDELKIQLQILESKSGIKGRFAKFQHLDFVHFEKV